MENFLGVWQGNARARAEVETRASFLYAPRLHFSLDGVLFLCGGGEREETFLCSSHLFLAYASQNTTGDIALENLERLYKKYGRKMRKYLLSPVAFSLYDSRKGCLFLGGNLGKKCYLEARENGLFFSSLPHLLKTPIPVDFALFRRDYFSKKQ